MNKTGIVIVILTILIGGGLAYQVFNSEEIETALPDIVVSDMVPEPELPVTSEPVAVEDVVIPAAPTTPAPKPTLEIITKPNTMSQVTIETNKGNITVELFESDAPVAAENFLKLARDGYYNGVIFHRVISGFMIQGGDPTGSGSGGPGYTFDDELDASTESYKRGYVRGTLAMANAGPNTNGSQFFIMHADYALPNAYTIFGRVTDGMEVVDAIAASEVGAGDRPREEVVMESVSVVE